MNEPKRRGPKTITLGALRAHMAFMKDMPEDTPIFFGGGNLSLYRLKNRGGGEDLIQFEFNELYEVTMDPDDLD
ncbi:hypothetical protein [Roseateles sp. P5_E7]